MKVKAFTLTELLIVLGIIGILAALLFPTVSESIKRAKVTAGIVILKNAHTSYMLYRADYTDTGAYGAPSIMGLPYMSLEVTPQGLYTTLTPYGTSMKDIISPCGNGVGIGEYAHLAVNTGGTWEAYVVDFQDNMYIAIHPNCNSHDYRNRFRNTLSSAVLLNGSATTSYKLGSIFDPEFYALQPGNP